MKLQNNDNIAQQSFYSHGKLLLTGEYVVLDGALSLAVPTKYGQHLHVSEGQEGRINWSSYDSDGSIWYSDIIDLAAVGKPIQSSGNPVTDTLIKVLSEASAMNHRFLKQLNGYEVRTVLTFPRNWGLGSSSTLISNIAEWAQVDPFELLHRSFGGSGYDIACARSEGPLLYRLLAGKPEITIADFNPSFKDNLYFVYLNRKQNSREAIAAYKTYHGALQENIMHISDISAQLLQQTTLMQFNTFIDTHEQILSVILQQQTVKQRLFPDFNGSVKSLGAWGGDFILATSETDPADYFSKMGFTTVIRYSDMVL